MNECTLSVVMPVYNEEPVIRGVLDAVAGDVLDLVPFSELVVVDDRSTDATASLLAEVAAGDPRIRVLTNPSNAGHGVSVRRGFDAARGEWILQIDSDGQVDLTQFSTFWARRGDADLVTGVRAVRHDPRHRLVLTRITMLVVSVLARRWLRDANAPFKLVRGSLVRHLSERMPADAFAPSILVAVGAARSGARIREVEIDHLPRPFGRSTLRVSRLARACVRSGWQTLRFSVAPMPPYRSDW